MKNWKDVLRAIWSGSLLEVYCNQVKICIEIALNCVDNVSSKRPDIMNIIDKLNEIETEIGKVREQEQERVGSPVLSEKDCRAFRSAASAVQGSQTVKHHPSQVIPNETCSEIVSGMTMHDETLDKMQHFNNMTSARSHTNARCNEPEGIPETSPDIGGKHIVGRTDEKEKIIGSLLQCMPGMVTIIPIYGIGGIGKTTLAKLIYDEFTHLSRVWVYVSQTFDLNKIRNSIILQLSEKNNQANEIQDANKKILIVLDDLWEDNIFQLNCLKDMLSQVGGSSTLGVLVTTRSEHIAAKICSNHEPYKIGSLTDELCWDIIKQRSCFEARHDKEHLIGIGKEISTKCRGVALAAQSLGFMLQSMTSDQWREVRDSAIWNDSISEDASSPNDVFPSLKLSYDNMNRSLKLCFNYCAIFPRGHKITPDDLIYQWISLGFVKPTRLLSAKELSEKYIMQLQGLSFLENSLLDTDGHDNPKSKRFTMHDLVHDLARSLGLYEILAATIECSNGGSRCYALLPDCGKPLKLPTTSLAKTMAIHFVGGLGLEILYARFSSANSIRVLDLSECNIRELPDFISQLKQLRYLNAPRINGESIPDSITGLSKLVYLNLSGSPIIALPESIGELKRLMHLDISECENIKELPESFVNLKKLVYLDLSHCTNLQIVPNTLVGLTRMQYLNLSNIPNCAKSRNDIAEVIELEHLDFSQNHAIISCLKLLASSRSCRN